MLWLAKGLGLGGAEQLLVSAASRIDRSRFDVDVAYLLPWKDALVGRLTEAGLHVTCLGQTGAADPRWVLRLRRLARDRRYDLVHTHMPVPAAVARAYLPGNPALVHTEHNMWQRYRRPTYWANALTYARNDHVIAVSRSVAGSIRPRHVPRLRSGRPVVEVVHHGASLRAGDAASADEARRRLGLPPGVPVVGTVGNLTPKKDQATMIRAVAELRRTVPDARLVLVGSGPAEDRLRALVAELGVADAVTLAGARTDVPELLPAFDVFCMTSRFEGLSIALLEAMSLGLPPVVTDVGGMPEVVRHEVDGLLVSPGDACGVARSLRRLLSDSTQRACLGAAARERARAFDLDAAVRRMEDIYTDVLAAR